MNNIHRDVFVDESKDRVEIPGSNDNFRIVSGLLPIKHGTAYSSSS